MGFCFEERPVKFRSYPSARQCLNPLNTEYFMSDKSTPAASTEVIISVLDLAMKYGIPLIQSLITTLSQKKANLTPADVLALKALVKDPRDIEDPLKDD